MKKLEQINEDFKKIIKENKILKRSEMRYLVSYYYQIQHYRIQANNQIQEIGCNEKNAINFIHDSFILLENDIKKILDKATSITAVGVWMKSIIGIGPVISSGLISHLDITKARHASCFSRFAGLDPTIEWKKGEKRPFNSDLKCLCWKAGESFVKVSGNKNDFYGKIYKNKKELEICKNERKEFKNQAEKVLNKNKISKSTDAYKYYINGMLPPAHIHARSIRYVEKIFLNHIWAIMYEDHYEKKAENPYVIEHLGHKNIIEIPNKEIFLKAKEKLGQNIWE